MPIQSGVLYLDYQQSSPASTWNIAHNFGKMPIVEVNAYDDSSNLTKAFPYTVTHVDVNNVQITWTSARAGYAILSAEQ
jgi:hypothetical protein